MGSIQTHQIMHSKNIIAFTWILPSIVWYVHYISLRSLKHQTGSHRLFRNTAFFCYFLFCLVCMSILCSHRFHVSGFIISQRSFYERKANIESRIHGNKNLNCYRSLFIILHGIRQTKLIIQYANQFFEYKKKAQRFTLEDEREKNV